MNRLQYLDRADIILGGGSQFFDPDKRKDKRDLFADFAKAGYEILRDRDQLLAAKSQRLLGTFTPLLSAVPLPALPGGLRVSSLRVGTASSYVVASGNLE